MLQKNIEIHCFGTAMSGIPWAELQALRPDIKKSYDTELKLFREKQQEGRDLGFLFIPLTYGRSGQNLCVLLPKDGIISEQYLEQVTDRLANIARNMHYKRTVRIMFYTDTMHAYQEDILSATDQVMANHEDVIFETNDMAIPEDPEELMLPSDSES